MMELIVIGTDCTVAPELVPVDDCADPDELIERAQARSREGRPREIVASLNGLPIARFAGAWMWRDPLGAGAAASPPSSWAPAFR